MILSWNLVWRKALKGTPSKKEPQPIRLLSPSPSNLCDSARHVPFPSLGFSYPVGGLHSNT